MRRTFLFPLVTALLAPAIARAQRADVLDTVRVAARAGSSDARSVEVLTAARIARMPARTLGEVLARALGVEVPTRSAASSDLSIRGSSFEQVLVLVDGVRVSDDQTGHFDLDLAVPLEMIERIEILRGAGSSLYGADAVGGVLNIVTREASGSARSSVRAQGGSFGTGAFAASQVLTLDGGTTIRTGADWLRSDGHRSGTDYDVVQGRAGLSQALGGGQLDADAGYAWRGFGAADFYAPFDSYERTQAATLALRWRRELSSRTSLSLSGSTRGHWDKFILVRDDPEFYLNRHETWLTGGEATVRHAAGERVSLAAGGEAWSSTIASTRLGDRAETRVAGFAELALGGGSAAGAVLGARVDGSSRWGTFVTPSLAAHWHPARDLRLRASGAGGFRAPTWTERYYQDPANVGDPTLGVERFRTGELGAGTDPSRRLHADVALWTRQATDLIDWTRPVGAPPTEPWRLRAIGEATFDGIELALRARSVLRTDWTLRAAAIDIDAEEAEGYVGKSALRPLTRSAVLTAELLPIGPVLVRLDAIHGRRPEESSYTQLDTRLAVDRGAVRFTLDLLNLTGSDHLDAAGKPVAGIGVYAGVQWSTTALRR